MNKIYDTIKKTKLESLDLSHNDISREINLEISNLLYSIFCQDLVWPKNGKVVESYLIANLPLLVIKFDDRKIVVVLDIRFEIEEAERDLGIEEDLREAIVRFATDRGCEAYLGVFSTLISPADKYRNEKGGYRKYLNEMKPLWIRFENLILLGVKKEARDI